MAKKLSSKQIGAMKAKERKLEATPKKTAAEMKLEQKISKATGKPYKGKR